MRTSFTEGMRWTTWLGCVLGTAAWVGCGGNGAGGPPPDPVVEVVIGTPIVTNVEDTLSAVGTVEANERVELKPEAPGLVEAVLFTEGERVVKGTALFELDARKEQAALKQAEAEEKLARMNLERAQTLSGTKAISPQEVDQLASQLEVRSAYLNVQREILADRTIRAPFDGVLGPRLVSPGQYVNAGTLLGTLVDDATVKVRSRVPERGLPLLRLGQKARLRVNAYPDREFEGKVDLISPEVDVSTRTAEVRMIARNPEGRLKPGMFARVEIVVAVRDEALVVPEAALVPSLDDFSVYQVTGGVARLIPVELGVRMPGRIEVAKGLAPDSELVLSGTQKLVDGMKVKPATNVPPPTAQSRQE